MSKKITTIISGSDPNNFWMLENLCKNLNELKLNDKVDINIIDIDLKLDQKKKISKLINSIIQIDWPIKLNFKTQNWKKLLLIRPFLKEVFPGYKNYIWLDSDTLVQNISFYKSFTTALNNKSLLICPELDISYEFLNENKTFKKVFFDFYKPKGWVYKNNLKYFGKKFAIENLSKPLFNAGVFCLRDTSNFWELWKEKYINIVKRSDNDYCLNMDQASLNYLIFQNKSDVNFLDTKFNWLFKNCLPLLNKKTLKFHKNQIPNEEISILHYTQFNIRKKHTFLDLGYKKIKFKIL